MKASEFVKKFGLKLAQRDIAALDSGFIKLEDFLEHYGFDILDDLKRLVESHELVQCYGGYDLAKNVMQITPLRKSSYDFIEKLKQAIADVESCQ